MPQTDSPIFAEIDVDAFRFNFEGIRNLLKAGTGIIAVVKADAYGHGAGQIAAEAVKLGASFLAVARLNEALALRDAGIDAPVILFGDYNTEKTALYIDQRIRPSVNSIKDAEKFSEKASALGKSLTVHVKVDTGMGRLGLNGDSSAAAESILQTMNLPFINVEGVYSHFANSDSKDKSHAMKQLTLFKEVKNRLSDKVSSMPLFHIANSAAIMEMPEAHLDLVRPGIILYGLYPSKEVNRTSLELKPVMSLKSRISYLKQADAGFSVSYGSTYKTTKKTLIATVPAGYADGYSRLLSSKGEMLVRGRRAPVIGRICMDLTMLDVTGIPGVSPGDEVVLMGYQESEELHADEIALKTDTINYEIVSAITSRVTRKYVNNG